MRDGGRGSGGRWRSALIAGLLSAAILLVALLTFQAIAAWRIHRELAESVLRDYARVAADELIRRVSVEVGYRGYYPALTSLRRHLEGPADPVLPDPSEIRGAPDGGGRPARELIATLFLVDAGTRAIRVRGAPLEEGARSRLVDAIASAPDLGEPSGDPMSAVHLEEEGRQRTFIYSVLPGAPGRPARAAGFEVDFDAMEPWLDRAVAVGPLLPASLGEGGLSNDLLSVRVGDRAGRTLYASGPGPDPLLTATTGFGEAYSGVFDGLTVLIAIPREAAPRLVIGGLPRSRLPVLTGLLVLTAGLLAAAIHQLRRERALARMRSEFVSRVSHELRTPLTQIRMFAETLLLGRTRSEEERRRSLEIVDQEARRLGHLVENILQFSRGDRGAIRLAPRPVEMAGLLRDVAEKFRPVTRARRVRLAHELEDDVVCLVDDDAMRQVVLNLLDNAVKYGPAGQEIRLGLRQADRRARIWVDDEGPGVPEAERRRIWIRWQRMESHEKAAVAGTGIGLTVVRDLVGLQGGRAWVEEGERGGARFVVEIPRMDPERAGAAETREPVRRAPA